MIRSMTGFGKAECKYAGGKVAVELKAVNHRFYELSSRMPSGILFLEDKIRSYINTRIRRGRVNLNLIIEGNHILDKSLAIDKGLAKRYYAVLNELKSELGIRDNVSLDHLVSMPEVIGFRSADIDTERTWPHIKAALDAALVKLIKTRAAEGALLCKDLEKRADIILGLVKKVRAQAPQVVTDYKKNLKERISQISPSLNLDQGRLEAEVTIFAKNCDITEETTRVTAHIKSFKQVLSTAKEAGRRLDFIAQELFREFNTIGSKAQDIKISRWVIEAKEQIEKIREQAQNVE